MGAPTERLLSRKGYSEFGMNSSDGNVDRVKCRCFRWCSDSIVNFWNGCQEHSVKLYQMGRSDPRKIVFAVKMGFSLSLISLLIFFKEPLRHASQYSIWAILTVVVVFEFSVGIICFNIHAPPFRPIQNLSLIYLFKKKKSLMKSLSLL